MCQWRAGTHGQAAVKLRLQHMLMMLMMAVVAQAAALLLMMKVEA